MLYGDSDGELIAHSCYHLSVRSEVLRYIRERGLMRAGDRVAVAVSGGADSVALLRVMLELRLELGVVIGVAHFNHGLRGADSEADEAFVADLARQHGLGFLTGRADVRTHALTNKLSVEAAGRELRYAWLTRVAADQMFDSVATAHTLDDQAETILLKLLRGAGTRGLAGIFPSLAVTTSVDSRAEIRHAEWQNPSRVAGAGAEPGVQGGTEASGGPARHSGPRSSGKARIVRPLLSITRERVEAYLSELGQSWREDESNLDQRLARNRVRHKLLPLLQHEYNPNIRKVLSDTAELSRAEEEYWQALVERELEVRQRLETRDPRTRVFQRLKPGTSAASNAKARLSLGNFAELPLALRRRLLRSFAESHALALDFEHVEMMLRCACQESARAGLPGGWLAARQGQYLELHALEPAPGPGYEYTFPIPGEVHIPEIGVTLQAMLVSEASAQESTEPDALLSAKLLAPPLTVRNWCPGDRFGPVHARSEAKLKRLFLEQRIPPEERLSWPVVLSGERIVWVRGFPVARSNVWSGRGDAVKIEAIDLTK